MFSGWLSGCAVKKDMKFFSETGSDVNIVVYPCGTEKCWFDPKDWSASGESLELESEGVYRYSMNQFIRAYSNEGKYIYLSSELLEKSFQKACLEIGLEFSRMCLWCSTVAQNKKYPPAWYDYLLRFMNERVNAPDFGIDAAGAEKEDKRLFPRNYILGGFGNENGGNAARSECIYLRIFGRWYIDRTGAESMKRLYSGTVTGIPALGRAAGTAAENLQKEFILYAFRKYIAGNEESSILGYDARSEIQPFGFTVTRIGKVEKDGPCMVSLRPETVSGSERLYIIAVQSNSKTAGEGTK